MKTRFLLLLFLLPWVLKAQTDEKINLGWKFFLGDDPKAKFSLYDDSKWRTVVLPHDFSIESAPDKNASAGNDGGYFQTGICWYRKSLFIPEGFKGKKITLWFEGVYMDSEVYVNGRLCDGHNYGYTSFECDITHFVVVGKENVIAVRADNSKQKNCRWYSGSGIYRNVRLKTSDKTNISDVFAYTSQLSENKAVISLETEIENLNNEAKTLTLKISGNKSKTFDVAAKSREKISEELSFTNFKTWSPKNPHLTEITLELFENEKLIDCRTIKTGIRKIEISVNEGLKLNGEKLVLNGGCVHHDNGILGASAYDDAEIRKVELLKKAGFNAVRTSHNPPSEMFLKACDSIGLLVIDEAFDGWYEAKNTFDYAVLIDKNWRKDLSAMILRDRSHPSVFCYSIGNEILERKSDSAVIIAKQMVELCHQLDPYRPVTQALASWDEDWEIYDPLAAAHDVIGYNYLIDKAPKDHERVPERIIIQTESYPKDAYQNFKYVTENQYILGDFVWTAIDYLGESGIGRFYYDGQPAGEHWQNLQFPAHGAYCGDVDFTGWRKPISHYRSMLYNDDEKLYLSVKEPEGYYGKIRTTMWGVYPQWESWNWKGFENKEITVEVFSKYPKVRLYLNNKLLGEKSVGDSLKAVFQVKYKAGVLKAEGLDGKKVKETKLLKTSSEPFTLKLTPSKKHITADGNSLCFIEIEALDKDGNFCPEADNLITFEVDGQGDFLSAGNADIKDVGNYTDLECNLYKGRALAVVRSKTKKGKITFSAVSLGLKSETLEIFGE
ncbi:MAG: DUF4982 domain-containing protein [Bacteroidales bacterium]|nr:DUF4982 domain-containing protein [Bacteroidales bacterium]